LSISNISILALNFNPLAYTKKAGESGME